MSIEAMKLALEALEELHRTGDTQVFDLCYAPKVIPALRTAIAAQPAPAPGYCKHCKQYTIEEPLPAAQRQWVGLTDEEISDIAINNPPMVHEFARAIEAKLKEKNT